MKRKNRTNRRKHGISFETAVLVFNDPYQVSALDREVEGKLRWQTIGMVKGIQVLLGSSHPVGIRRRGHPHDLSARKATLRERSIYAQGN